MESEGYDVTYLPVSPEGIIDLKVSVVFLLVGCVDIYYSLVYILLYV